MYDLGCVPFTLKFDIANPIQDAFVLTMDKLSLRTLFSSGYPSCAFLEQFIPLLPPNRTELFVFERLEEGKNEWNLTFTYLSRSFDLASVAISDEFLALITGTPLLPLCLMFLWHYPLIPH